MLVSVDGKQYDVPGNIVIQIRTGKWEAALKAIRTTCNVDEELSRAIAKEVKNIAHKDFFDKKEKEAYHNENMGGELHILSAEATLKKSLLKEQGYEKAYEYKVISLLDNVSGCCDTANMENALNKWALDGWRVKAIVSNELGKNALAVMGIGVNATVNEITVILEREYNL